MMPYPSSQVSCVPTVATQPTANKRTPAPSHAKRPRIVALSSSTYRVPIAMHLLNLRPRRISRRAGAGPTKKSPLLFVVELLAFRAGSCRHERSPGNDLRRHCEWHRFQFCLFFSLVVPSSVCLDHGVSCASPSFLVPMPISMAVFFGNTTSFPRAMKCEYSDIPAP